MIAHSSARPSTQQGIALLQVLLVSAVISILAIQFSYSAKQQVELASLYDKRVRASMALKSAQQTLFFHLLTNNARRSKEQTSDITGQWNFYNQPFYLADGVSVQLQDHAGLLPQTMPRDSLWLRYLTHSGYNEAEAKLAMNEFKDWQDTDNDSWFAGDKETGLTSTGLANANRFVQTPYEANALFSQLTQMQLHHVSTHYPVSSFNPLRAPDALFRTLFDQQQAEHLLSQRDAGSLASHDIRRLLPPRSEVFDYSFLASSGIRVFIEVSEQDVTVSETVEIRIQRSKPEPLVVLARY